MSATADLQRHDAAGPTAGLLESLRHHLLAGETHYPVRPGMTELRERVDALLSDRGVPSRGPGSVLITAGEGEALFVTLLALGLVPDGEVTLSGGDRHTGLFAWTGVTVVAPPGPVADDPGPTPIVRVIGGALFEEEGSSTFSDADILVGSFDALSGMGPFRLGFVAGAPETISGITKWKQASSICSPAPSQRAALWALGVRP